MATSDCVSMWLYVNQAWIYSVLVCIGKKKMGSAYMDQVEQLNNVLKSLKNTL